MFFRNSKMKQLANNYRKPIELATFSTGIAGISYFSYKILSEVLLPREIKSSYEKLPFKERDELKKSPEKSKEYRDEFKERIRDQLRTGL